MATKIQTAPRFDPRTLPGGKDLLRGLDRVRDAAVELIGGCAVTLLGEHPGATRADGLMLTHRLWERVRALECDDQHTTVEAAMSAATLPSSITSLGEVVDLLLRSGDLRRSLLAARASIDLQLDRLSALAPASAATKG